LRSVLGKHELDEMLAERDRLNADIQQILDQQTDAWGIKVTNVEIKHIDLNESMVRAIAKQAEAERLRRAKVINAEGEQQAAEKLVEAGKSTTSPATALPPLSSRSLSISSLIFVVVQKSQHRACPNKAVGRYRHREAPRGSSGHSPLMIYRDNVLFDPRAQPASCSRWRACGSFGF
jgi:hypothetical protein